MKTMLKKAQKGTSATVIAIVTHEWRLRLWLRSSSQNGDRDCDCDCDSLSCLWLCANWATDCDCDSSGDCDPVGTCVFCDYDYSDSAIGSSGVVTATSFFRALVEKYGTSAFKCRVARIFPSPGCKDPSYWMKKFVSYIWEYFLRTDNYHFHPY